MDQLAPCPNTYNNINYRHKSHTMQPNDQFLLKKYFASTKSHYANVPNEDSLLTPVHASPHQNHGYHHHQLSRHSHHSRSLHQRVNSRAHSHVYHTMCPISDPNSYYNISHVLHPPPTHHAAIPQSRHSLVNEPPPPLLHDHPSGPPLLDNITVMKVVNELGHYIDSSPPMPESRQYTISRTIEGLFKLGFPQMRIMKADCCDPTTNTSIRKGEHVTVLGPSKEDRSKFTIYYGDNHLRCMLDLPHQQFHLEPPIGTRWN